MKRGEKMKKKLLFTLTLFACVFLVITSKHASAIDDHDFRPDFGRDMDAAELFGERKAKEFQERLTPREQELFEEGIEYNLGGIKHIHTRLDYFITLPDEEMEDLEAWDSLFRDKGEQSTGQQFIYLYLTPNHLGYENGQWDNGLEISIDALKDLADNFQYMNHSGYIIGDLVSNNIDFDNDERLIVRLRTPVGTRQIFTGDSGVLLERDQAIQVSNWRIITEKGRQVMLFEADLVPKERFLSNIEIEKQRLNTQLKELLKDTNGGIEVNIEDPIRLNLATVRSQASIHDFREMISEMGEVVPSVILKDLFQKHSLHLELYDRRMLNDDTIAGLFENKDVRISIFDPRGFKIYTSKNRTMIHEIGHAVDYLILSTGAIRLSETARFRNLFQLESKNLTSETSDIVDGRPYGTHSPKEYFAEVFSAIYTSDVRLRELMRAQVPNTYQFIEDQINNYIRYGDVFLKINTIDVE